MNKHFHYLHLNHNVYNSPGPPNEMYCLKKTSVTHTAGLLLTGIISLEVNARVWK
jgi:hypothetical protein